MDLIYITLSCLGDLVVWKYDSLTPLPFWSSPFNTFNTCKQRALSSAMMHLLCPNYLYNCEVDDTHTVGALVISPLTRLRALGTHFDCCQNPSFIYWGGA